MPRARWQRSAAGGGNIDGRHPPLQHQLTREISALPVATLMVPMRTALIPTIGNPVVATTLVDIVARSPDVSAIAPLPESRRPHESDARFRDGLDADRRRGPRRYRRTLQPTRWWVRQPHSRQSPSPTAMPCENLSFHTPRCNVRPDGCRTYWSNALRPSSVDCTVAPVGRRRIRRTALSA